MRFQAETIVAVATPPGRGGLGVVRLSGPGALRVGSSLLRLSRPLQANQASFARVIDPADGQVLDDAVATYFQAPRSYTGEDVVEISAHGAPVVMARLLELCCAAGARLAAPGEFTQRAFLNGRLELTQAEAVRDLIEANTLGQARAAAAQLGGALSRQVAPVKHELLALIAGLEAGVDFAEDDLDLIPQAEIASRMEAVRASVQALAATFAYGRVLREGARLAIVGRPNVGKSSLFNRLLGHERAIVTEHAGTTRDVIAERFSLHGVPVELVDTAGLRDAPAGPAGEIEAHGIARTRATMAEADLVLHVLDASAGRTEEDAETARMLAGRPCVVAWNKTDLAAVEEQAGVRVSARTGEGFDELRVALASALGAVPAGSDTALVTNLRQHQALQATLEALQAAAAANRDSLPHELLLLDLHRALGGLDELTGTTTSEDILGLIFSTFCIGK